MTLKFTSMFMQHLATGYSRRMCGISIIVLLVIWLPSFYFDRPRVQSRITGGAVAAHSFLEAAEVRVVVVVNNVKKKVVRLI